MHLPHKVFVYGTLKTGEPNYFVMSETAGKHAFIDKGLTVTKYPLIIASSFNVPMIVYDPGNGDRIHGEVYAVDDDRLKALDKLECHPEDYRREIEKIELSDGTIIEALMYSVHDWSPEIFEGCAGPFTSYTSAGSHQRPYSGELYHFRFFT
ncbi:unnamed protein product, partial [Mesorhabditis belari]|uniref:Gamma-glutamylcyclotransferase family protein n=1 Tax=Mesorhabditis belari TaxID=2138241 RepID=A0AAF3JAF8_9BILA